jgi:hypothetical protein
MKINLVCTSKPLHGFINVDIIYNFNQSYLPYMNKNNGKLMSLNIEAIK